MAGTLGEADAKFPTAAREGIPPSPTRENPGQVYPKSDPSLAPHASAPGREPTLQQKLGAEERAKFKAELGKVGGKEDPQSAESGGMFTD